jgi:chromosome segregation ATPase
MANPTAVLDATEPTLLRVPFEGLKRAAKDRKAILDEAQEAVAALKAQAADGAQGVDRLIMRLQGLKRKLSDVSRAESKGAGQCKARLEHLQKLSSPLGSMISWNRQRMNRILVDHLQR